MANKKLTLTEIRRKALSEIDKTSNIVSVWVITKDKEFRDRITLRWSKTNYGRIAHVAFFMYVVNDNLIPLGATVNMSGFGYDKFSCGIGEIFQTLKPQLKEYFGIQFNCLDWEIMYKWQSAFQEAGYEVFQAL